MWGVNKDNLSNKNVSKEIFSLFLETLSSTFASIIQMKHSASENTMLEQVKCIRKQYLNMQFTRSLWLLNLVCKTVSSSSPTCMKQCHKEKNRECVLRAIRRSSRLSYRKEKG